MNTQLYALMIVMLGLSAIWVFAINASLKALRGADPALYQVAVGDLFSYRGGRRRQSARPGFLTRLWPLHRWMRRQWRHHDVYKHRAVRRWMYVHHGALSALIAVFGVGVVMALFY